jgi:hypothetical protein
MSDFTTPRVSEKKFYTIPDVLLTTNGTANGIVTIASTFQYKVGMVVQLFSATQTPRRLKIKRVISDTQMQLGDEKTKINEYSDLTTFLTADTATVRFVEQQRPVIDINEINRQVYEEEPTVALRNHLVDWLGRSYDKTNPMPVQLSDGSINIGTVNAELEVALSHKNDNPNAGDVADSVRIGDGQYELRVNSDGSINIAEDLPPGSSRKSLYNEVSSIASAAPTALLTYTVPPLTSAQLETVDVSGSNVATYQILVNGSVVDKRRTYFGNSLNDKFDFGKFISLSAGDIVVVRVEHTRPSLGDFNARLTVTEKVI